MSNAIATCLLLVPAVFSWLERLLEDCHVSPALSLLQVAELQKRTSCLPDDYFVVLVGDMITEEALPTYMAMLNTLDGVRDETGAADTPWGRWNRAWTAEENRHGDLMNKYCYLSGRVNMKVSKLVGFRIVHSLPQEQPLLVASASSLNPR